MPFQNVLPSREEMSTDGEGTEHLALLYPFGFAIFPYKGKNLIINICDKIMKAISIFKGSPLASGKRRCRQTEGYRNNFYYPFRFATFPYKGKDFQKIFDISNYAENILESSPLTRGDADRQRGTETTKNHLSCKLQKNKLLMIKYFLPTVIICSLFTINSIAQYQYPPVFNHQDTLRGTITPEREWWDLTYYHLSVNVNPADSTITGTNLISYRVLEPNQKMQIDLQPPMEISKISQNGVSQEFVRDGNAWFVTLKNPQKKGEVNEVLVEFGGKPKISRRPPWDGGISWKKDEKDRPFIVNTNQGDGASLWWPCKDHPYDEPDSMLISVTFPESLMDVSNGRLRSLVENNDGTKTANWFVDNPINNYGVNFNIGNYVHFSEVYQGEKGDLDCNYWVLDYDLDKAKEQFKQAPMMLEAFEHWFGPYPFYEDGYKLVEVPYPGMEHQSSVTYGNGFTNGYGGRDESHTGLGMKFDFIIVHESGHEWFANNITNRDEADMWIHESFTAYSENLFVEYFWGKEAGADLLQGNTSEYQKRQADSGNLWCELFRFGRHVFKGSKHASHLEANCG